jgi:hypothetical protein
MGTPEETAPATPTQVEGTMLVAMEGPAIPAAEVVEATEAVEMPVVAMALRRMEMVEATAAGTVTAAETAKVGEL